MKLLSMFLLMAGAFVIGTPILARASDADLVIPDLSIPFPSLGGMTGTCVLQYGLIVAALGIAFGLYEFIKVK